MKQIVKKAYIEPVMKCFCYGCNLMQVPESFPQGNGDDPIVDDEGDILSKEKGFEGWGDLW